MIQVAFSSSFKKAFDKRIKNHPEREGKFWKKVDLFMRDPFSKSLRTHKLSGQLKDLWSFSVEFDLRIVFYFEKPDKCVFIDIGTHEEVY
jgi:addiction module RelE/StbE family toxin